jgi:hypothetical protein
MIRHLDALTMGTAGASLSGMLFVQMAQSPGLTLGTIALAAIGLASIAIRGHYEQRRLEIELEIARRLGSCSGSGCPFSRDGRAACVPHTLKAGDLARPHSEGS